MAVVVHELLELSFGLMLRTAFDEVCAAVVLNQNSVQVLGFVGQTVVRIANNLCSSCQGSYSGRFL